MALLMIMKVPNKRLMYKPMPLGLPMIPLKRLSMKINSPERRKNMRSEIIIGKNIK
jgi:hypothetical protein